MGPRREVFPASRRRRIHRTATWAEELLIPEPALPRAAYNI
jgi:hypothetical protein